MCLFQTHEDQIKAIRAFDNQYFLGNKIKVEASIVKHRMVLHGQQLRKKEERIIEEPLPRDPKQMPIRQYVYNNTDKHAQVILGTNTY